MIVISNKPGQLGNLLFIYAHFLAYSIENNSKLINPSFYEYRHYFAKISHFSLSGNKSVYFLFYFLTRMLVKLKIKNSLIGAVALDWGEEVDLENTPLLKSKICFVQGWLFRSDKLVIKYKDQIKNFFSPTEVLENRMIEFFKNNFLDTHEQIIGVHIRRGDYKTFEGGKYYYSNEQYISFIKQLALIFESRKPHFLICSNELLHFPELKGLAITYAPGHELLDMYCLAKCNYIIGPPSTYSMWASFYGSVPLYKIEDVDRKINKNDFQIILSK